MSRSVEFDARSGLYRVAEDGEPLTDPDGRPLGFEDHQRAAEVAGHGGDDA
ncbi:hypothetical protein [Streptacidiphilus fuscans]|uniref:Uncharacterized protein n=1 Tax=Streptacidiphilus fuscans TaxID=2789292 RepID=A0A931B639_9ACTN|nr:hypothetical protein [Streptacidiphilus fuscans]MBF9068543.1 hypothetical protein [Streptacidiphilus fuscans]